MKKALLAAICPLAYVFFTPTYAAQYKVVELPVSELGDNSFPTAINNAGEITVNLDGRYNPPIDTTLIDFESAVVIDGLDNLDGVRGGDLSDDDYEWLYAYITANAESQTFQQIASLNSYLTTESYSDILTGFDTIDPNTDDYRNSATTEVRSINNFGYTVGVSQDGFYTVSYFSENYEYVSYVVNDFYSRGFAQIDGNVIELSPPDTTAGGLSDAFDINTSNQVVGIGTTEFSSEDLQTSAENCADPTERGDVPEESCLRSLMINLSSNISSLAQQRGIIWQLDEKGNVTDTYVLGMLIEPDENDVSIYSSSAVAINDYGVAVGTSPSYYQDSTSLTSAAAIYQGESVSTINPDEEVYSSTAYDINNDHLVVGHIIKDVNGSTRTKFFVHDMEADLTLYPDDFFEGSSSVALSINNEGFVVGYGESESSLSNRRTEGFIYDYKNDLFQGLNSLLECNSPYTIVQANGINDNNEIVATALVTDYERDIRGDVMYDEYGATIENEYAIAVKLEPISGGSIDNCEVYEEEEVRQGASLHGFLILNLASLVFIRRFRFFKDRAPT